MFFYVNIDTEHGIADKLLLFKIKFVVIYNLLINSIKIYQFVFH